MGIIMIKKTTDKKFKDNDDKMYEATFFGDVINCVKSKDGEEYNLHETIELLNSKHDEIEFMKSVMLKNGINWEKD